MEKWWMLKERKTYKEKSWDRKQWRRWSQLLKPYKMRNFLRYR